MNWMKYSLWAALMMSFSLSYATGDEDFTKEYHESFEVQEGALLTVTNKYGNIQLDTWERNVIDVKVVVTAKTSSRSHGDRILDRIDVDISGGRREVRAITAIASAERKGWLNIFSHNNDEFEIEYKVIMPRETKLNITNKYGHIYCNDNTVGDARFENKYGNIYAQNIDGDLEVMLGYGDAKIENIHNLDLTLKYGNVELGNLYDATIESKYSKIEMGNVQRINSTSKYDGYRIADIQELVNDGKYDAFKIQKAHKVNISTKYTGVKVENLTGGVNISGGYNTLKVHDTSDALEYVNVSGKYCNVRVGIAYPFTLNFSGEYVTPSLPRAFQRQSYEKDGNDISLVGHMGSSRRGASITAEMRYGSFVIFEP